MFHSHGLFDLLGRYLANDLFLDLNSDTNVLLKIDKNLGLFSQFINNKQTIDINPFTRFRDHIGFSYEMESMHFAVVFVNRRFELGSLTNKSKILEN